MDKFICSLYNIFNINIIYVHGPPQIYLQTPRVPHTTIWETLFYMMYTNFNKIVSIKI